MEQAQSLLLKGWASGSIPRSAFMRRTGVILILITSLVACTKGNHSAPHELSLSLPQSDSVLPGVDEKDARSFWMLAPRAEELKKIGKVGRCGEMVGEPFEGLRFDLAGHVQGLGPFGDSPAINIGQMDPSGKF